MSAAVDAVIELIREYGPMSLRSLEEMTDHRWVGLQVMLKYACRSRKPGPRVIPQRLYILRWDWYMNSLGVRRRTPVFQIGRGDNRAKPPPLPNKVIQSERYHRRKMQTLTSVFAMGMSVKTRLQRRSPQQIQA